MLPCGFSRLGHEYSTSHSMPRHSLIIAQNNLVEGMAVNLDVNTATLKRSIDDINVSRRQSQEKERGKVAKLMGKRDEAIYTAWQIKSHIDQLASGDGSGH